VTPNDDAGETLVESLITMIVISIAILAIVGAVATVIASSQMHRSQADAQAALRNWAEALTNAAYHPCATPGDFNPVKPDLTSLQFTPLVTAVTYWDRSQARFVNTCPSSDTGIQKVSLEITVPRQIYPSFTQSLDVIVREPCESAC
jgi:Tfp pilus assembly protein PilV